MAGAAAIGAIVGDSIGYAIGRRGGRPLLERLGRRFPKHLGPPHLARAERTFARWGVWAVFFGRFIALLRILAGPLAGALQVPYRKFLLANATGGIVWAFGTVFAIYYVGQAAEEYLKDFSWVALVVAVVAGPGHHLVLQAPGDGPRRTRPRPSWPPTRPRSTPWARAPSRPARWRPRSPAAGRQPPLTRSTHRRLRDER